MKSVKTLIMLILLLLVALFLVGMGVMSSLNLEYSQAAMSELRLRQIEETFYANLDRIEAHHKLIEKNTVALARLGEAYVRARQKHGEAAARNDLEAAVRRQTEDFPEAFGGGLWFDPGADATTDKRYGLYAYWQEKQVRLLEDDGSYDYTTQDWYQSALPSGWDRANPRPETFYWTPAYFSSMLQEAVVTLVSFVRDENGHTVGLATTDWRADEIIRRVSNIDVTPGSFAFLIDSKNRKLSSLSETADSRATQAMMEALSIKEFSQSAWAMERFSDGQLRPSMLTKDLFVEDRQYRLFFSRTRAGMVFGIGVPQDEIDSVLEPMRRSNFKIATLTGAVLVALSGIILYIVAGIMRLLEALYTDTLTGLPNRAKLLRDIRIPKQESIILLNIDSFKEINDSYGYQCGDHVLASLARELQAFLRGSVRCQNCVLYKLPADEFAIVVRSGVTAADLDACMRDLYDFAATRQFMWEEQEITVSVTLGAMAAQRVLDQGPQDDAGTEVVHDQEVTTTPEATTLTGEQILSSASIALRLARQQIKHHFVYDPSLKMHEEYEQNLIWAKRLKAALQEDRLVPHFQPIFDNNDGRIVKYECLVRLLDDDGKALGPGQFLPVAKKLRLYRNITRIMVEKSFAAFKDEPYEFSLNLSYEDLSDPEVTDFIERHVRESGIAERVIFEILESEGIENYQQVSSFIAAVKAMGCRIAIDDFGSGYSNFEHLLRLNADMIKIDSSLIRSLDTNQSAWIVTQGIVRFARDLKMKTVAEFVHSEAVMKKVLELGIDFSQGAHIGMPDKELQSVPRFRKLA